MEKEVFIQSITAGSKPDTFSGVASNVKGDKQWDFADLPITINGQAPKSPEQIGPPTLVEVTIRDRQPVSAIVLVECQAKGWEQLEEETQRSYRVATGRTGKDMNGKGLVVSKL